MRYFCSRCGKGKMQGTFLLNDYLRCDRCSYATFFVNGIEIPHSRDKPCDCYGCVSWREKEDKK